MKKSARALSLIGEARRDFELFHSNKDAYEAKVECVSKKFKADLIRCLLPTYFAGNYRSQNKKYVLFGLNPHYGGDQTWEEEKRRKDTWKAYMDFSLNFYKRVQEMYDDRKWKSSYYRQLLKLFSKLDGKNLKDYDFEYYNTNVINIDLIPYISTRFPTFRPSEKAQREYLEGRLEVNKRFLQKVNTRLIIINGGKTYYQLLKELCDKAKIKKKVDKVTMYFFALDGKPCVLFDKFIPSRWLCRDSDLEQAGLECRNFVERTRAC